MIASALAVAVAMGLYWSWAAPLAAAPAAVFVVGHALAGLAIGLAVRALLRSRPRGAAWAGAAAAWLALGVAPAVTGALLPFGHGIATLAAAAGGAALLGIAAAVAGARAAGATGALGAAALGAAALAPFAKPSGAVMPERPVVAAERDAGTATFRRVAAIGLDGADWAVIDAMVEAGEMPNLAALRARGRTAVLLSSEPTYSPVVWSSIFSGKTPEKHGITGWYVAHAANRRAAMLWEILAGAGLASAVVNVPGSWPPAAVDASVVSGFPIPSALRATDDGSQLLGWIVDVRAHEGPVPTVLAREQGDALVAELALAEPAREPRGPFRHRVLDRLVRRGVLRAPQRALPVRIAPEGGGRRLVEIGAQRATLAPGEWSPWWSEDAGGVPVRFRVRALDAGLYVTPFFQDPAHPVHAFASSREVAAEVAALGMYVVEGTGWKIAGNPELRDALFEHLADVEEQHLGAALALAARGDWSLLAHVITITDRISHGFWPFRDPVAYGLDPDAVRPADAARVADAYRRADALLGRLLAALPSDTTVLLLSDHGFRSHPPELRGDHRLEGIWLAAGPGIAPDAARGELDVVDVTPTILAGLGLPVAEDMDGRARLDLLGVPDAPRAIASYEGEGAAEATEQQIDASTEEQLRSLGYVE